MEKVDQERKDLSSPIQYKGTEREGSPRSKPKPSQNWHSPKQRQNGMKVGRKKRISCQENFQEIARKGVTFQQDSCKTKGGKNREEGPGEGPRHPEGQAKSLNSSKKEEGSEGT